VAKRLDWEKEAKRLKVLRDGADFGYDELPAVGSPADKTRYLDKKGYRQAARAKRKTIRFRKRRASSTNKFDVGATRQALETIQREMVAVYSRENSRLMDSEIWRKLSGQQRRYLRQRFDLQQPEAIKLDTQEAINATLREGSLAKRRNLVAALPRCFQSALEEATRLLVLDGRIPAGRK